MSSDADTNLPGAGRIPMADSGQMSEAQQCVYDKIVSGKRGRIVGPLRAALHSPELADRWQMLGEFLRYGTQLPAQLSELAIIVTGRFWNCQLEWLIHAEVARKEGLDAEIIESIRTAQSPAFSAPLDAAVYEYTRELLEFGQVSDSTYRALLTLTDEVSVVELTGVIGYYSMVAMTLNAHQVPLPEDEPGSLLELPGDVELLKPTRLPRATLTGDLRSG